MALLKQALIFTPYLFASLVFFLGDAQLFAQGNSRPPAGRPGSGSFRDIITKSFQEQSEVRHISQVTLSSDGSAVVWSGSGTTGGQAIFRFALAHPAVETRISALSVDSTVAQESEPAWAPGGKEIAFLSDANGHGQSQIYIADGETGVLVTKQPLTRLDGYVSHLKWSPDGRRLSVLYVEKANRRPSPTAAENRPVGLIDSLLNSNVQRIAVINRSDGKTEIVSPGNFYVFEYDWSPDSKNFVFTGALPPGDDNWYVARLYRQPAASPDTQLLYTPAQQIAIPRWSRDGKQIGFVEGLMSDEGGTGGELFSIPASGGTQPLNLLPERKSTPSWFTWQSDGKILFTEFVGGSVAASELDPSTKKIRQLWKADASIRAGSEASSISVATNRKNPEVAFVLTSWNQLPEIYQGTFDKLNQVTHLNPGDRKPFLRAENIEWINDELHVQGWLLYPKDYDSTKNYPLLVNVHGGPAWITTPTWIFSDFNTTVYTQLGYFVFFPNPRGSYGQGEAFTRANRRDWGFGDLRDITSGVDQVLKNLPIDSCRVGLLGWSYGGSTAMFAVTQTQKFKAAVAGAGAGDWLSYYGQNNIDKWMFPYFGASPYDDPAAYAKSSAMTYIKNTRTPTLILAGERDGESPSAQAFQFWHALKELHIPTQLMVYPDEGHGLGSLKNRIDVSARTIEWIDQYLQPCAK